MADRQTIMVTGATEYIGGRLVPRLIEDGHHVRVLVHNRKRAMSRSWSRHVEVVVVDALDTRPFSKSLAGVDTAYYLIHSMSSGSRFHDTDIIFARVFGQTARETGIRRIIYLGVLGESNADLPLQIRSRREAGEALRE